MPIYEYQHEGPPGEGCRDPFEQFQRMDDAPLERCPRCGQPCRRVFSSFAAVRSVRGTLHPRNLERLGFTQYKRGEGGYEKTFGDGPDLIKK